MPAFQAELDRITRFHLPAEDRKILYGHVAATGLEFGDVVLSRVQNDATGKDDVLIMGDAPKYALFAVDLVREAFEEPTPTFYGESDYVLARLSVVINARNCQLRYILLGPHDQQSVEAVLSCEQRYG